MISLYFYKTFIVFVGVVKMELMRKDFKSALPPQGYATWLHNAFVRKAAHSYIYCEVMDCRI